VVLHEGVILPDVEASIRATVEAEAEGFAEFRLRLGRGDFPVC
jgi:hypothetical protein